MFVSATTGQVGATGDKAHPLTTIADGIAKAVQIAKSRVYVCKGTYSEQVVLDAQHDGISLYGGFECTSGWSWVGGMSSAQVQGPTPLYALRIDATTKAILVEDLLFSVPSASGQDANGTGNSSIAAFVSNESAGVRISDVSSFQAGAGTDGNGGGTPSTNLFPLV